MRMTITVPEAARRLGIGRNSGYEAVRRGDIPVIRVGKRLLVPLAAFEAMLATRSKQEIIAAELVRRQSSRHRGRNRCHSEVYCCLEFSHGHRVDGWRGLKPYRRSLAHSGRVRRDAEQNIECGWANELSV